MAWDVMKKFLYENVDIKTNKHRLVMSNLDEASKVAISDKLVSALYRNALNKSAFINYGDIPNTKGDITRLKDFDTLTSALANLQELKEYCDIPNLDTINETLRILQAYKKEFCLGYMQNKSIPILIYNNMVMSVICGTSACIVASIDYLRTPNSTIDDALKTQRQTNTQTDILFDNMAKFNEASSKGDLKKMFNSSLDKDNFIGSASIGAGIGIGAIVLVAAIALIPVIRELIYFFYNMRMKIADFFEIQAYFLKINVAELKSNGNAKKDVIKRQEQRIKTLEKIANKFEVEFNSSTKKSQKELSSKVSTDDLETTMGNQFTLV